MPRAMAPTWFPSTLTSARDTRWIKASMLRSPTGTSPYASLPVRASPSNFGQDMASRVPAPRFVWLASAVLALALPALAQAEGDPERGRQLAYTCYGCHGVPSYKNVYPTYSVPKLQGQPADYLVIALQAYRTGERSHATMHSQAASLSDQDMQDIAAFLAGKPLEAGNPPEGKAPAKVA